MNSDADFERVYAVWDYWDGPRRGIADFRGGPHAFESRFDESIDDYSEYYELSPIDQQTLVFALEAWELWQRWETAFHQGSVSLDTHPALPEDQERSEQLQTLLKRRVAIDFEYATRAKAVFKERDSQVHWEPEQ